MLNLSWLCNTDSSQKNTRQMGFKADEPNMKET